MKCDDCGKELDVTKNVIPPEWYGFYSWNELIAAICPTCIKKPENKDWSVPYRMCNRGKKK